MKSNKRDDEHNTCSSDGNNIEVCFGSVGKLFVEIDDKLQEHLDLWFDLRSELFMQLDDDAETHQHVFLVVHS